MHYIARHSIQRWCESCAHGSMFCVCSLRAQSSSTALQQQRSPLDPLVFAVHGSVRFEIPPLTVPLPAFPAIPADRAAKVESIALETTNRVLQAMRLPRLNALKDLFAESKRWFATYEELDHYGSRVDKEHVGVCNEIVYGKAVDWAGQGNYRVFAYLRPEMPGYEAILRSLCASAANVICFAPNVAPNFKTSLARPGFVLSSESVQIDALLPDADLCISYAPAGTVATTLLRGIPQRCAPPHVEAKLTRTALN